MWRPFRARCGWGRFPGLKPRAESYSPFGARPSGPGTTLNPNKLNSLGALRHESRVSEALHEHIQARAMRTGSTVPSGTEPLSIANPGTSCLANITLSLRDKRHSSIEAPISILALMG